MFAPELAAGQPVPVCVLALAGEESALMATLACCGRIPREALLVLSPPASPMEQIARQAGCRWSGKLPESFDTARYWCQVSEVLAGEVEACWVLRAGTRLPDHWQRRLALTDPECVAIFPLSVRHPCTSIFTSTRHKPGLSLPELDRWLNRYLSGRCWDIPLLDGQTALLRPARLPPGMMDDRALARQLRQQGNSILASDNLLVDDRQLAPSALPEDLCPAWRQAILHRHPLTAVRHAMTELSVREELAPSAVPMTRPAILHICHGWGGGLWHWVEDFVTADQGTASYILKPVGDWSAFGQTLALYTAEDRHQPLQTWTLSLPILSTDICHFEYRVMLETIVATYGIEAILVSSLIGHALDVLLTELPTLVVTHDFYPVCPAIVATWGSPCTQCEDARLAACLVENPEQRFFLHQDFAHWQTLRSTFASHLLTHTTMLIVPSASVSSRLRGLLPELAHLPMRVIPHGLPQPLLDTLRPVVPPPLQARRPRVLVLGSLDSHKGGGLLREIMPALREMADVYLWGCGATGSEWEGQPNVTVRPRYERQALGELLSELRPDVGLLLSVVPETFSYTLSELQAATIPTAATNLGAFADRIEDGVSGWLMEPRGEDILEVLRALFSEPERLASVRKHLAALPRRSAKDMVNDYMALLPVTDGLLRRPRHLASTTDSATRAAVVIDPEARVGVVLRGFLGYIQGKLDTSPRLPGFSRKYLRMLTNWLLR